MRRNPTLSASARRVTQPEYWAAITRAALPRTAAMERAALAELELLDTLDVLKWSGDLGGVGTGAFEFGDWRKSLSFLGGSAAGLDLQAVNGIGHTPSRVPPSTYEITEEQYWDAVRQVLDYALRERARYTSVSPEDDREALASELWFTIHGHHQTSSRGHPHATWPHALDVLRHTQNLDATLLLPGGTSRTVDAARGEITYDWLNSAGDRRSAIELLATLAMWSDALRMGTSAGRYMPNPEDDESPYWDVDTQPYWVVDTGGDAFDQPTRQDGIDAARELVRGGSEAVFVWGGGSGGEEPEFLIWTEDVDGEWVARETTDPEVMVLVADKFGLRSLGMPIPESWPPGMTPNIRPDAYWKAVQQMTVRTHYPVDYRKDVPLAATFVVGYEDALDALRLSSDPGMIGPWLTGVMAPKPSDEPLYGSLPPERNTNARDLTVAELVVATGRVAALADTDWWAKEKKPYPSPAPPVMSLDDYIAYVRQAAITVARSPNPVVTYEALLDAEPYAGGAGSMGAHPLIALPRGGTFQYRVLDVLLHTAHPEAIWENAVRRIGFEQPALYDRTKVKFNEACGKSSSEQAFAWLASAAFGADILDELSVMGLSKYAPNAVG